MHLPVLLCALGLLGGPWGVASQEERRLDLPTCLESFDVHQDKIIRTQDSRAMGAKYINERDVPTREDCLRLCCETQDCDVFVFEEKTPGSCYLFQCGTPEDFKCKFTKHHNYTSAVLVLNRHMTELESQIKHTQHEHELAKLRKPELLEPVSPTASEVSTTVAPGNKEVAAVVPTAPEFPQRSRCSRYQFECHGSGECIAIYNACDGIPQCADGSDEAPELGCPAQGSTAAPVPKPKMEAASSNVQQPPVAPPSVGQQNYRPNNQAPPQNMPTLSKQFKSNQWTPQMFESPQMSGGSGGGGGGGGSGGGGGRYGSPQGLGLGPQLDVQQPQPQPQQQVEYPQPPPELVNQAKQFGREGEAVLYHPQNEVPIQWPPASYQQEQQMLAYRAGNNGGSQIFSHKGGLMAQQDSLSPQFDQMQPEYGRYNNYYESAPYHKPQQGPATWHKQHVAAGNVAGMGVEEGVNVPVQPNNQDYYYEENFRTRLQPQMIPQRLNPQANVPLAPETSKFKPVHKGEAEIENQGVLLETQTENKPPSSNTSVKKAAAHHPAVNTSTEKPKETHHHAEHHHNSHRKVETLSAELSLSENSFDSELDGANVNPRGAILSLTMGLCVTGIMLVLVGCRMRMVRRRMRRGSKSPYAHDADFLVNGMYL